MAKADSSWKHTLKAIIFDLDGTLVESSLDFNKIREDIGCDPGQDILNFVELLDDAEQKREAEQTILRHELEDARNSNWVPGAEEFVQKLLEADIPVAIVTRNSQQATQIKIQNNRIPITNVITRELAPPKPQPTALLNLAEQWSIPTQHIAYIGDYLHDVNAANNANMMSWLFAPKNRPEYADLADVVFTEFEQLNAMLNQEV